MSRICGGASFNTCVRGRVGGRIVVIRPRTYATTVVVSLIKTCTGRYTQYITTPFPNLVISSSPLPPSAAHSEFSVLNYSMIDRGSLKLETVNVCVFDIGTTDHCLMWANSSREFTVEIQSRRSIEWAFYIEYGGDNKKTLQVESRATRR